MHNNCIFVCLDKDLKWYNLGTNKEISNDIH